MVVVCGGLLQPPHLPLLSTPGWDTRQPGRDTVTMIECGIADYGLVQVDATEYNLSTSFEFFCSCFYVCSKNFNNAIMIYYSQYRAFTKLMSRCSDAVLHPGSWQPTQIITTAAPPPPSWHPASSHTRTRTGPGGYRVSGILKPELRRCQQF